jgi:hypothetical protein
VSDVLKWVILAAAAWVADVLACAAAYWINRGQRGMDLEWLELLWRSAFAAFLLTVVGALVWVPIWMFYPTFGTVFLGSFIVVPIAAQVLNWVYGMDDWLEGLSVCLLRIVPFLVLGPGLVLLWRQLGSLWPGGPP